MTPGNLHLELLTAEIVEDTDWWTTDPDHHKFCPDLDPHREFEIRDAVLAEPEVTGRYFGVAVIDIDRVAMVLVETYTNGTASIALSVRPDRRRQGLASAVLRLVCDRPELVGYRLRGDVHPANVASRALMLSLGAVELHPGDNGLLRWELPAR